MQNNIKDRFITNIFKADLILSDITLATDSEEKKVLLDLLDYYVMKLDDPTVTTIFNNMTGANGKEREIYTEILVDIFNDRKAEIMRGV